MNERRIGIGIVAWFLGIIVPTYHHVALHAAVANQSTNNIVTRMQNIFEFLPWIDWVYLGLMFGAGLVLVVSGFGILANHPLRRTRVAPRGFEVIATSERSPGAE